jgi:hypothetical protein
MELDTISRHKPENPLMGSEPRLYVCSGDGLGSTGKTAIQNSLRENLQVLLSGIPVGFFKEPPVDELAGFSPYGITTKALVAPEALGPYLAAVRGCMWNLQDKSPWKVPDNPIIVGDRSPAASFLQGAYPGGDNPWGSNFWKVLYGNMDWIPFPDILPLLFPDDINKQIERLKKRKLTENEPDQFDDPNKQVKQFEGFKALADVLFKFPGVYRVISGKIKAGYEDLRSIDPGFVLSLLTTAYAIEKGIAKGITEPIYLPSGKAFNRRVVERLEGDSLITCYLFNLSHSQYFIEASIGDSMRSFVKEKLTARFGDIGICWPFAKVSGTSPFVAAVYALEPGAKDLTTEEILGYIHEQIAKKSFTEITKDSRYGRDLFGSRFPDIKRAWGNITW